ncbi:MAG: aminotransferase class V-fold PLP-dependent enzyme [Bacteroidales bacterium]|jgi:glutamate/tyrosine decarboxylase-like PLP-dependent enzyme|nr:aminotransferase class V-fold PLP-dependent enzyme [Bacteroidales bacterium]MDY0369308.1 aminotransferase class V-fold PLP-dependent enzyme [Bacteroidales bacterium]
MKTEHIIEKLQELSKLSSQLEITDAERDIYIQQLSDFAGKFISGLSTNRSYNEKKPASLAIQNGKTSFEELLNIYEDQIVETGIRAASGKFMGYIPAGGIVASALADFLAALTNPYASVYYASPGAATLENEVIRWLKSIFSFPESAIGSLQSGGSISTLVAFTAARDAHHIKNEHIPNSVVYLSHQAHHSTHKALRIIGLEDVQLRYIPLDSHHRIRPDALQSTIKADIAAGLNPFLVVGTAGTTDTGAIDPLKEMAAIAHAHNLWFHVDAAYGGFFILTSKRKHFDGIEQADSLIVDPHKGMFLPYGTGAVLIKDAAAVLHSQYYEASYMQDAAAEDLIISPANISPELTKHFRGLRVWLPLQLHGVEPFQANLEEKIWLTHYFRNELRARGFSLGPEPDLSVSYFWYPFNEDMDTKNRQLMDEIHADGEVFLSSSIIDDQFVIRIAILSFRTKKESVDQALAMIDRCLQKLK